MQDFAVEWDSLRSQNKLLSAGISLKSAGQACVETALAFLGPLSPRPVSLHEFETIAACRRGWLSLAYLGNYLVINIMIIFFLFTNLGLYRTYSAYFELFHNISYILNLFLLISHAFFEVENNSRMWKEATTIRRCPTTPWYPYTSSMWNIFDLKPYSVQFIRLTHESSS